MAKTKTETKQSQQYSNQYGYMNTPITPQMQSVIDLANKPVTADPSTFHRFAAAEDDLRRGYNDPFGAATSPDVREKAQRSQILKLHSERDKAMREGYFQSQNVGFARKSAAAALTMPQLVQTGGSSSGTSNTTQGQNAWGTAMQLTGAIAPAAMM